MTVWVLKKIFEWIIRNEQTLNERNYYKTKVVFHPRVHVTVSWFGCKIGHFICYLLFNIWYYIFDFKFEMVQLFLTIQYIFMYGYFFLLFNNTDFD